MSPDGVQCVMFLVCPGDLKHQIADEDARLAWCDFSAKAHWALFSAPASINDHQSLLQYLLQGYQPNRSRWRSLEFWTESDAVGENDGHGWIARPCTKAPDSDQDNWQHWQRGVWSCTLHSRDPIPVQRAFKVFCPAGRECMIEVVALSEGDAIEKAYAALEGRRELTLVGALTRLL